MNFVSNREEDQEGEDYIGNDEERESEPISNGIADSDEAVDPPSDWEAPNSVLVRDPTDPGGAGTYYGRLLSKHHSLCLEMMV